MGVRAPVSSVTPGCAFHLPHRNSPCPRSHSPEKGKAASHKCLSGITAEPLQYGDGAVYLPAICTGSSGRVQPPAPGKPRPSCALQSPERWLVLNDPSSPGTSSCIQAHPPRLAFTSPPFRRDPLHGKGFPAPGPGWRIPTRHFPEPSPPSCQTTAELSLPCWNPLTSPLAHCQGKALQKRRFAKPKDAARCRSSARSGAPVSLRSECFLEARARTSPAAHPRRRTLLPGHNPSAIL